MQVILSNTVPTIYEFISCNELRIVIVCLVLVCRYGVEVRHLAEVCMNIFLPFPKSKCFDAESGARIFLRNVGNMLLHDTDTQERDRH